MFDDITVSRFWNKVDRRGPNECWEWAGTKTDDGYALLSTLRGSHISLILHGRPRTHRCALHSCDNPGCVNPNHLRWGTDADNANDMVSRKRHHANSRSHCIHGHELSGENLIQRKGGQRGCRTCQKRMNLAYYHRNKGQ